jgi:hypothetical protein
MKLLIMQFSQISSHSPLFCPNILLSTLFSNTLSLCSSLNVTSLTPIQNHYKQNLLDVIHWCTSSSLVLALKTSGAEHLSEVFIM